MSDIYFIVIPVVVVVIILKLCLIFWRIWAYQKRNQRIAMINTARRRQAQAPTARVIGVERTVGPEGFTQRTAYMVSQPGLPARQVTRTLVIRPNDNRRPDDPNLPPTYDQAVTGKDKSVKVEACAPGNEPSAPPPPMSYERPPPPPSRTQPAGASALPPPAYSQQPVVAPSAPILDSHDNYGTTSSDTTPLLPQ